MSICHVDFSKIEGNIEAITESGCHIYMGYLNDSGYGVYESKGKSLRVHRLLFEKKNGPIPSGMFVCHKCDTPSCVNPNHLFLGTPKDNMDDMHKKGRGKCGGPPIKLTQADADKIKTMDGSFRSIAKQFSICHKTVAKIKSGKIWSRSKIMGAHNGR